VLSAAGCPLLIDPGTYAYHTQLRWREYFRGTSAHNTLRVDGQDQSVAGGPFLWTHHAKVSCLTAELGTDTERIVAEHDGYRRLAAPLVHRREVAYQRSMRLIRVTDQLRGSSTHQVEMFWHFAKECQVTLGEATATAMREGIGLVLRWPAPLTARLVRGSSEPPLGWISERFDQKSPIDTLVVAGTVAGDWQGVSTLQISGVRQSGGRSAAAGET